MPEIIESDPVQAPSGQLPPDYFSSGQYDRDIAAAQAAAAARAAENERLRQEAIAAGQTTYTPVVYNPNSPNPIESAGTPVQDLPSPEPTPAQIDRGLIIAAEQQAAQVVPLDRGLVVANQEIINSAVKQDVTLEPWMFVENNKVDIQAALDAGITYEALEKGGVSLEGVGSNAELNTLKYQLNQEKELSAAIGKVEAFAEPDGSYDLVKLVGLLDKGKFTEADLEKAFGGADVTAAKDTAKALTVLQKYKTGDGYNLVAAKLDGVSDETIVNAGFKPQDAQEADIFKGKIPSYNEFMSYYGSVYGKGATAELFASLNPADWVLAAAMMPKEQKNAVYDEYIKRYGLGQWVKGELTEAGDFTANMVVPLYWAKNVSTMSPGEIALNIALDALIVVPVVKAGAAAAGKGIAKGTTALVGAISPELQGRMIARERLNEFAEVGIAQTKELSKILDSTYKPIKTNTAAIKSLQTDLKAAKTKVIQAQAKVADKTIGVKSAEMISRKATLSDAKAEVAAIQQGISRAKGGSIGTLQNQAVSAKVKFMNDLRLLTDAKTRNAKITSPEIRAVESDINKLNRINGLRKDIKEYTGEPKGLTKLKGELALLEKEMTGKNRLVLNDRLVKLQEIAYKKSPLGKAEARVAQSRAGLLESATNFRDALKVVELKSFVKVGKKGVKKLSGAKALIDDPVLRKSLDRLPEETIKGAEAEVAEMYKVSRSSKAEIKALERKIATAQKKYDLANDPKTNKKRFERGYTTSDLAAEVNQLKRKLTIAKVGSADTLQRQLTQLQTARKLIKGDVKVTPSSVNTRFIKSIEKRIKDTEAELKTAKGDYYRKRLQNKLDLLNNQVKAVRKVEIGLANNYKIVGELELPSNLADRMVKVGNRLTEIKNQLKTAKGAEAVRLRKEVLGLQKERRAITKQLDREILKTETNLAKEYKSMVADYDVRPEVSRGGGVATKVKAGKPLSGTGQKTFELTKPLQRGLMLGDARALVAARPGKVLRQGEVAQPSRKQFSKPRSGSNIKVTPQIASTTNTATNTDTGTGTKTNTEAQTKTESKTETETKTNTKTDDRTKTKTKTKTRVIDTTNIKVNRNKLKKPLLLDQGGGGFYFNPKGSIAWPQGKLNGKEIWYVFNHPYKQNSDIFRYMGELPEGVKRYSDKASAYKGIQLISGEPPKDVTIDSGIQDIRVFTVNKLPKIQYTADPKQRTTHKISIKKGAIKTNYAPGMVVGRKRK